MPSVSARDVVEAFKRDRGALAELAGLIAGEPDLRLVVINAMLRDVATRDYVDMKLEELRREMREEIRQLRAEMRSEMQQLRGELGSYLRWTVGLIIAM